MEPTSPWRANTVRPYGENRAKAGEHIGSPLREAVWWSEGGLLYEKLTEHSTFAVLCRNYRPCEIQTGIIFQRGGYTSSGGGAATFPSRGRLLPQSPAVTAPFRQGSQRIPQSPAVTAPFRQGSQRRPMAAPTVKPRGGADKSLAGEHSSPTVKTEPRRATT